MKPPTRGSLLAAAAVVVLAHAGSAARADLVHLRNGQKLEGDAVEANGEVSIRSAVGTIGVPASIVLRIERAPSRENRAVERLRALRPDDVDARVALAVELHDAGSNTLAQRIFGEVLERDPDHPVARRALGYVRCDEQWLTEQECHRRRGDVLHDGQWVSADQRLLLERLEHERRQSSLERLRAEMQVEAARLEVERQNAALAYESGGAGADPFGYPYDPYYGGAVGVPFWPGVPVVGHGGFGRHGGSGHQFDGRGPRVGQGFRGGADRGRHLGPLHHRGGQPPRPLVSRQNTSTLRAHRSAVPPPGGTVARPRPVPPGN